MARADLVCPYGLRRQAATGLARLKALTWSGHSARQPNWLPGRGLQLAFQLELASPRLFSWLSSPHCSSSAGVMRSPRPSALQHNSAPW